MTLLEAARILDEVIPPPHDKMVDGEHFNIAIAWQEIKVALNVALKQTYAEKVITALRDDGHASLSFKDVACLTTEETAQVLNIAEVYSAWLDAVKDRAGREACSYNNTGACIYPGLFDSRARDETNLCVNYTHCNRFKDYQKKVREEAKSDV